MRLWGRKFGRRRMLCVWLLLLAFMVVTLTLSDLLSRNQSPGRQVSGLPDRPLQRSSGLPPDVEIFLDSQDPALELGVDLSPLKSLQEDELLFVPSTQDANMPPHEKGIYKVVLPGTYKDEGDAVSPMSSEMDKAASLQEPDKDQDQAVLMKYGFNEVLSERISLHRRLPEARHAG